MSALRPFLAIVCGFFAVLAYFFFTDPVLSAPNGQINLKRFKRFDGFNLSFYKPERYQGQSLEHNFFEGWYIKLSGKDRAIAVICGLFKPHLRHKNRTAEAFIMIVDSQSQKSHYIAFDVNQFIHHDANEFNISIGSNHMSRNHVSLDIEEKDFSIKGEVNIKEIEGVDTSFPVSPFSVGAMGFYNFVPILECYHGIVTLDANVDGSLDIQTEGKVSTVPFEKAYIEKDFGSNFPTTWLWAQTNSFAILKSFKRASLTLSVASVPALGMEKIGYIVGMLLDDDLYMFTPFLQSKISSLMFVNDTDGQTTGADLVLQTGDTRLEVELRVPHAGIGPLLHAPSLVEHRMAPKVTEYLDGEARVKLFSKNKLVFDGKGIHTGIEMEGTLNILTQLSSLL